MTTYSSHPPEEPNHTQTSETRQPAQNIQQSNVTQETQEPEPSEERFRILFEAAPDAYYLSDLRGTFLDGNRAAEAVVGYTREELVGKNFLEAGVLPLDQIPAAAALLSKNREGLPTGPDEFILNRKDGSQVTVEIRTFPIQLSGQAVVLGIIRDISARKHMEAQLRHYAEQQQRYASDQQYAEEQLRLSAERLGLLHDIDQAILSGQTLEIIASIALQRLRQLVPCQRAGVVLLDFINQEATLLAADVSGETQLTPGLRRPLEALLRNSDLDTFRQGHQYEIDDLLTMADPLPVIRVLQAEGMRAYLVTPLIAEEELIGILNLGKSEPQGFTPAQKEIVRAIASQLAIALQRTRDTAARRLAEEALRISEQQYRLLFAQNPHPMWVYDVETFAFLAVNEATVRHYGYTREEFLAMTLLDIRPSEDAEHALATTARVPGGGGSTGLWRHRKKDGALIQVEESANDIEFAGRAARVLLAHDVTARLQAEAERQEEADITAALVRVGRAMISSLDTPTITQRLCEIAVDVLDCDCCHTALLDEKSDAFVNVAGYGDTPEQWELLRMSPMPRETMAALGEQFLAGEEARATRVTVPGQSVLDALLQQTGIRTALCAPLRRGAQIFGVLIAAYRSDREFNAKHHRLAEGIAQLASLALANAKLVEELQDANRLKDDFVGAMSHELRTPLNVILGYTELLIDDPHGTLSVEQRAALRRVDQHAQELVDLVNNLLDINRLRTRSIPLQLQEVALDTLFDQLKAEVPSEYQKPTVDLRWQFDPIPFPLYTDLVKLKIVLKNLVNNALKFTDKGSVTVVARLEGAGVEFSVSDTGIGIPPEHLPLIFEAFRQVDSSSTRSYGGVGLGLYIARQLLDLLGGTITVDSTAGQGSTFRVWIPGRLQPDNSD